MAGYIIGLGFIVFAMWRWRSNRAPSPDVVVAARPTSDPDSAVIAR